MIRSLKRTPAGRFGLVALTAALLLPLAHAQTPATPAPMHGGSKTGAMAMPAGGMDMKAMMKDMNDKMASVQMSGSADVDFAMMMRIHHLGAIDMAQAQLRDGKDAQMRKMAKDIISAQKNEIAQLDRFLAKQGRTPGK